MTCVALIPVLGRPHRVAPTLASLRATAPHADVLFLPSPGDDDELDALEDAGADYLSVPGNYAVKINAGVAHTDHDHVFLGADDLEWHPGWYEAAAAHLAAGFGVVGVNDLCARRTRAGRHATHFLLSREYAHRPTIDGGRGPLCQLYDHSCVDDELVATARSRGALVIDPLIVVEHRHPDNGGAAWDTTYAAGRRNIRADRRLFHSRSHLWT